MGRLWDGGADALVHSRPPGRLIASGKGFILRAKSISPAKRVTGNWPDDGVGSRDLGGLSSGTACEWRQTRLCLPITSGVGKGATDYRPTHDGSNAVVAGGPGGHARSTKPTTPLARRLRRGILRIPGVRRRALAW